MSFCAKGDAVVFPWQQFRMANTRVKEIPYCVELHEDELHKVAQLLWGRLDGNHWQVPTISYMLDCVIINRLEEKCTCEISDLNLSPDVMIEVFWKNSPKCCFNCRQVDHQTRQCSYRRLRNKKEKEWREPQSKWERRRMEISEMKENQNRS